MHPRSGSFLLLALFVLLTPTSLHAADAASSGDPRWYISPYVGWHTFDDQYGRLLHQDPTLTGKDALNFGARFAHVWSNGVGYEIAGGWTRSDLQQSGNKVGDLSFYFGTLNVVFLPEPGRFGSPFLSAGGGVGRLSYGSLAPIVSPTWGTAASDTGSSLTRGVFDVAGGWMFKLSEKVGLRLEVRNLLMLPRKVSDWGDANVNHLFYGGVLSFGFGGTPRDTDGDGVPDKKDKCSDTPAGARVDATGCPTDADGDRVFDGLDKCPDSPKGATVDASGCPTDSDGDGVFDGLDTCADTPKGTTVDAKGCPTDSDGDGVFDGLDQCANTPRGVTVSATGCPVDSDGDGVPDGPDKCPNTPAGAKVDTDGCPVELIERETEMLDTGMIRIQNINFETAKADIMPESHPILDIVGQLLSKWPQLKIEIGGHTDSRGATQYNERLSEQRAQAVKGYLLEHFSGLNADQFTARGYGEGKPIAPNNNALNMAANRRVEFVVLNKDVLKKERETRRLQQK